MYLSSVSFVNAAEQPINFDQSRFFLAEDTTDTTDTTTDTTTVPSTTVPSLLFRDQIPLETVSNKEWNFNDTLHWNYNSLNTPDEIIITRGYRNAEGREAVGVWTHENGLERVQNGAQFKTMFVHKSKREWGWIIGEITVTITDAVPADFGRMYYARLKYDNGDTFPELKGTKLVSRRPEVEIVNIDTNYYDNINTIIKMKYNYIPPKTISVYGYLRHDGSSTFAPDVEHLMGVWYRSYNRKNDYIWNRKTNSLESIFVYDTYYLHAEMTVVNFDAATYFVHTFHDGHSFMNSIKRIERPDAIIEHAKRLERRSDTIVHADRDYEEILRAAEPLRSGAGTSFHRYSNILISVLCIFGLRNVRMGVCLIITLTCVLGCVLVVAAAVETAVETSTPAVEGGITESQGYEIKYDGYNMHVNVFLYGEPASLIKIGKKETKLNDTDWLGTWYFHKNAYKPVENTTSKVIRLHADGENIYLDILNFNANVPSTYTVYTTSVLGNSYITHILENDLKNEHLLYLRTHNNRLPVAFHEKWVGNNAMLYWTYEYDAYIHGPPKKIELSYLTTTIGYWTRKSGEFRYKSFQTNEKFGFGKLNRNNGYEFSKKLLYQHNESTEIVTYDYDFESDKGWTTGRIIVTIEDPFPGAYVLRITGKKYSVTSGTVLGSSSGSSSIQKRETTYPWLKMESMTEGYFSTDVKLYWKYDLTDLPNKITASRRNQDGSLETQLGLWTSKTGYISTNNRTSMDFGTDEERIYKAMGVRYIILTLYEAIPDDFNRTYNVLMMYGDDEYEFRKKLVAVPPKTKVIATFYDGFTITVKMNYAYHSKKMTYSYYVKPVLIKVCRGNPEQESKKTTSHYASYFMYQHFKITSGTGIGCNDPFGIWIYNPAGWKNVLQKNEPTIIQIKVDSRYITFELLRPENINTYVLYTVFDNSYLDRGGCVITSEMLTSALPRYSRNKKAKTSTSPSRALTKTTALLPPTTPPTTLIPERDPPWYSTPDPVRAKLRDYDVNLLWKYPDWCDEFIPKIIITRGVSRTEIGVWERDTDNYTETNAIQTKTEFKVVSTSLDRLDGKTAIRLRLKHNTSPDDFNIRYYMHLQGIWNFVEHGISLLAKQPKIAIKSVKFFSGGRDTRVIVKVRYVANLVEVQLTRSEPKYVRPNQGFLYSRGDYTSQTRVVGLWIAKNAASGRVSGTYTPEKDILLYSRTEFKVRGKNNTRKGIYRFLLQLTLFDTSDLDESSTYIMRFKFSDGNIVVFEEITAQAVSDARANWGNFAFHKNEVAMAYRRFNRPVPEKYRANAYRSVPKYRQKRPYTPPPDYDDSDY